MERLELLKGGADMVEANVKLRPLGIIYLRLTKNFLKN